MARIEPLKKEEAQGETKAIFESEDVSEELFKRLKSYFSNSEIVNLSLIISLMNVFNRFNGALGVELEK